MNKADQIKNVVDTIHNILLCAQKVKKTITLSVLHENNEVFFTHRESASILKISNPDLDCFEDASKFKEYYFNLINYMI